MLKLIQNVNLLSGSGEIIGFRQGDLDGACGIYSVVTAMVAGGFITRNEAQKAWSYTPDNRTKLANAISHLPVLAQDGTDSYHQIQLIKALEWYIKKTNACKPVLLNGKGKSLIAEIVKQLEESNPVIIHLDWRGEGAHAVVAVGYEEDGDSVPAHILVVDPGFEISRVQLWNGVLTCYSAQKGKKPYYYWVGHTNESDSYCQIINGISLTP